MEDLQISKSEISIWTRVILIKLSQKRSTAIMSTSAFLCLFFLCRNIWDKSWYLNKTFRSSISLQKTEWAFYLGLKRFFKSAYLVMVSLYTPVYTLLGRVHTVHVFPFHHCFSLDWCVWPLAHVSHLLQHSALRNALKMQHSS